MALAAGTNTTPPPRPMWRSARSRRLRGLSREDRGTPQRSRAPPADGGCRAEEGARALQLPIDGEELRRGLRRRTKEAGEIAVAVDPQVFAGLRATTPIGVISAADTPSTFGPREGRDSCGRFRHSD